MNALETLRAMLQEDGECRTLSDAQLQACLLRAGGDVAGAAYFGALIKAESSGMVLPDGTTLPDNRAYWLSIAQMYRPNRGGALPRADDMRR
ncbi:MAG: hypothetical protein RSJ41_02585 [Clostridia bacterium]